MMLPRDTVPGDNYVEQIGRKIYEAQAVMVLLSDNFITSLHCRNEIISAFENKKTIFPYTCKIVLNNSKNIVT